MMWLCDWFSDVIVFFFSKQNTAYEMRISDWSSDVCSSDLHDEWPETDHRGAGDCAARGPGGIHQAFTVGPPGPGSGPEPAGCLDRGHRYRADRKRVV